MRRTWCWGAVVLALAGCGGGDDTDTPDRDAGADAATSTSCGNLILDEGEECDRELGCGRRAACTPDCECAPLDATQPDTTQVLIDDALRGGTIDLGTALLYRAWAIYRDPRLPEEFDGVVTELEDLTLASEIDAAWAGLPPDQQAALEPFVVRPSDARSFLSIGYVMPDPNALSALDCTTVTPCEDWQSNASVHFRVWSCGDALSEARAAVLAELESLYIPMTAYLGEPAPDDADNAPGTSTIDAYIVNLNEARLRDGECVPIQALAGGQAVPAPPYLTGGDGRIGSGYLLLPPSIATDPERRSTLVHELFHIQQFSHSLQAGHSWITESTAVWAEWHFAVDDPARDAALRRFPEHAPESSGSGFQARVTRPLDSNYVWGGFAESYEAFIWHYFAEQEVGVDAVKNLWSTIANGGARRGYNQAVDTTVPFAVHFGDFIVRNINEDFAGQAKRPLYTKQYSHFPSPTKIRSIEEKGELRAGGRVLGDAHVRKLAAQYVRLQVDEDVREITFDFSEVSGGDMLDIEILGTSEPTRISGWKRLGMSRGDRKLTLCRDDGDEPVYEAVIALGNHDWEAGEDIDGSYEIRGQSTCCEEGEVCWTGNVVADYDLTSPYGTLREHIDATVSWHAAEGDPFGNNFLPTGSATFSGSGEALDCTYELAPVTFPIDETSAQLMFLGGDPPTYIILGGAVVGDNLLEFTMTCPDGEATVPSEAKPWIGMSDFHELPDPGDVMEGTETFDYGATYTWHFVRN